MRTVVGILRGGPSNEYEASLKTGTAVLNALDKEKYEPRDIFISRAGEWHRHGITMEPERALNGIDVAVNALHGDFGEDGRVARMLDALAVPYAGSNAFASATAYNKHRAKEALKTLDIRMPHSVVAEQPPSGVEELAQRLFRTFPHPAIVKPVVGSGSQGVMLADSYHALERALAQAFAHSQKVLVEEYIGGREASVGVIDNFRNEQTYALVPEPNIFSHEEKAQLTALAIQVHETLGLRHYSSADFIVGRRGVYFLEVNTGPKLHDDARFTHALARVGASVGHFLDHIISLATRH